MAEEIAEILKKFVLSTKELGGTKIDLGDVGPSVKECEESLRVVEVGVNTFQFFIPSEKDRDRISNEGLWIIDSQMLVVWPWFVGFEEETADFNIAPLWIQVWNLPVHWISKEVGRKIALVFQETKEVIVPQEGGKEGRRIKVLVMADISQPVMRGTTVKMDGNMKWVSFRYERCPDFCYTCGTIGHGERNCTASIQVERGHLDNQFGPWLRAGEGKLSSQKERGSRQPVNISPNKQRWDLKMGIWFQ
ncbi:uncharacterized protein LOC113750482 [Coffea eugenioides]|uniref:uncharacterized protein LOC113750482 n=1 Tax=Coffea eugenioides TaxID=49369 RepID=UPI000F614DB4|nr:uncharacterized protein LOC113750482 [Coffea eugenioides]